MATMEHGVEERHEAATVRRREAEQTPKPTETPGPGLQAVLALDAPTPAAVAAIFAAHPEEQAAIAAYVQRTFGNAFALEVVRPQQAAPAPAHEDAAPSKPAMDPDGPLGETSGVDAGAAATDVIAGGEHDENRAANEVFWQLYPALRGVKLKNGTPAAAEWLRVRDDVVRPALKASRAHAGGEKKPAAPKPAVDDAPPPAEHAAPATVHNQDAGGAEAIRTHAQESVAHAAVDGVKSDDPDIEALLEWTPSAQTGDRGEAAWLLAAIATGLVDAHGDTKRQLAQMAAGEEWIHSDEKEPGKQHQKHVDGVKRIGSGKYDVDVKDAPILGVLVALTGSRIREWVGTGAKKKKHLFTLGTLVRGDVGFGGSQHTRGHAIDIGGMNFNNDKDVLALLDGLPPGKVDKVFADNNDHVHVTVNDKGNFELGFPFQGNFFPAEQELPKAKKAAEKAAGDAADGATIHAEGMERYSTHWYRSTGTFKDSKWVWKDSSHGQARDHLQSAQLKALLASLHGGGGSGDAVQAAHEDGQAAPQHDR